ncbi:MAG: PQQ-dependent sugar dehydrogenase [Pseudomonadales bacterium]|nr:PQQ-dependent sugar dehydrogenase [Pseudomonadales bacterium]
MRKIVRIAGYLAAFAAVVIAGLYIYARMTMGAINFTTGEGKLDASLLGSRIKTPPGFSLGVYAPDIPGARLLRFTGAGDLLVAVPGQGKVMLVARDANGDKVGDGTRLLMDGLNGPNGLDFHDGYLYVAETDVIGRVPFDVSSGKLKGDYSRIVTGLPGGGNHWKKTLRFGPDGMMYVSMGSSCNVCIEKDPRRASMVRYQPDGTGETIIATGLRNSAGFDWRPADGMIYATDNGRDGLGDNFPPCELNRIEAGNFYGWPYLNGNNVIDPDMGDKAPKELLDRAVPPVHGFRAHNAPLGIEFVRGDAFPPDYRGAAIVALHGSWNRSEKDGYKVVSLHFDDDGAITERDLVWGFEVDDDVVGRPAEVTEGPDGAFYISDDYAGAVYRLAWGEAQRDVALPTSHEPVFDPATTLGSLDAAERASLAEAGQATFNRYGCRNCHNQAAPGRMTLAEVGTRYDIDGLSAFFEKPTAPMPIYPLSEDEKRALAVYLIGR